MKPQLRLCRAYVIKPAPASWKWAVWGTGVGVLKKVARMLVLACALTACNAFDGQLVPPAIDAGPIEDGGQLDGGPGGSGGSSGFGGQGGAGAGGQAGNPFPGDAGVDQCEPAPPDSPEGCVEICPERCNGEDDDCNGRVDEGRADVLCALDNAVPVCVAGECFVSDCLPSFRDCDDKPENGCEVPRTDVRNCGTCGQVCSIPGAVVACVDDACEAVGCADGLGDCEMESADCETRLNTPTNCGECGEGCEDLPNATAESCATGACVATECALGFGDCDDERPGCEQAVNTAEHCTECGMSCDFVGSSGDDCDDFVCRAGPCDDGYGECNGVRTDGCEPLTTLDNCGACNQTCGGDDLENIESASCDTGSCVPECSPGFKDCDEQPFTGCETSILTVDDCGECDEPCVLDNATATCGSGSCAIATCNPGWLDCNESPMDGCEKSSNDDDTCGDCDNECMPPDPVCSGGTCGDVVCTVAGTADCAQDGLPCEINLTNDELHCGACNAPCQFNAGITSHSAPLSCIASVCEVTCDTGWEDCNNNYRDGCETPLNTLTNCGSCGMACSIANAGESCSTGQCLVTTCATDFRDCDGDMRSCERAVNTTTDCGACYAACVLPNATPVCGGSPGARSCGVGTCVQFFDNCDGAAGNGCEVNLQTDADDCGTCNYDCNAEEHVNTATCSGGSCNFNCDSGFRDCNTLDGDGCETALNTATNCGGCGVMCSRANGMSSCSTGTCELTGCNGGFDECDGNENNGCESLSTIANCGDCGDACLPPNATGSCGTGTCQVSSCASGWANCDGDAANGCERNTAVLGPCLPEAGCTRTTFGGNEYFYCPTVRNWTDARARCRMQLYGDLVRIDSMTENTYVVGLIGTMAAWIGGTDQDTISVENQWRWSNDTALFWTGLAGGTLAPGMFARWNGGEPNNSGGNEDCAEILNGSGLWNDQPCATRSIPYVCEIAGDLCPADPMKTAPGQCGCGVADVDADMDRTMDCIDGCPSDPAKVAMGACGCNVADTDGDGDGTPNCNDMCPTNPAKVLPGMCGCATADTDSDNDGTANCNDMCPSDPTRTAPPCAFTYGATNYDATTLNYVGAPVVNLDCSPTIDTSGTVTITGWCGGTAPTPVIRTQSGGPEVAILPTRNFTLAAGRTLRVIGSRPLILSVNGDASILGNINVRGVANQPGAGGNTACTAGAIGDNGGHDSGGDDGSAGGAGGAYVTVGGGGGNGNGGPGGAAASTVENTSTLALRGGCQGGNGGGSGGGRLGGGGGGGIELSVAGTLTMSGTGARISTSGGAGARGNSDEDGGGGGGSGGMILIEAGTLNITGGWVTANGGGGASGNNTDGVSGSNGADGIDNGSGTTPGGAGQSDGGGGGGVGAGASAGAGRGGDGNTFFFFIGGAGGGGGGGGRGRIHFRGVTSCNLGGSSSPGATRAGVCQ